MDLIAERCQTVLNQIAGIVSGCDYDPRRDMHFIDGKQNVSCWVNHSYTKPTAPKERLGSLRPTIVTVRCPNVECPNIVDFTLKLKAWDLDSKSVCFSSCCPRCHQPASFYMTDMPKTQTAAEELGLWMHPVLKERKKCNFSQNIQFEIRDAYEEAVNCFNNGHYRATVTECGRALEGITHDNFTEEKQRKALGEITSTEGNKIIQSILDTYTNQLGQSDNKHVENSKELKKVDSAKVQAETAEILFMPLIRLSKAIRLGRLTGAHFHLKKPASREIADRVLDLTEYLIQYFYVLENQSQKLEQLINGMETAEK